MKFPLVGGYYQDTARQFDAQRCINLFTVASDIESSKERAQLVGTPGKLQFSDIGAGGCRGLYVATTATNSKRFFGVFGDELYEIDSVGIATLRGQLGTSVSPVSISDNGLVLCIVDGSAGYFFNFETNSFDQITDPSFPAEISVVKYKDSSFIFTANNTGFFYLSSLLATDPADCIDSTDRGSVESNPDVVIACETLGNEVVFFGDNTIEHFYTDATGQLSRVNGSIKEIGTIAKNSVKRINNTIFFLGSNKEGYSIVYALQGYNVTPVSTQPIEQELAKSSFLTDAIAYTYQLEGNMFYVLSIQSIDRTLAYCLNTGLWHELSDLVNGDYKRHTSSFHAFYNGRSYISDYTESKIHELRMDQYSDNGTPISRYRVLPHINNENKRMRFTLLEVDIQKGVGLENGVDNDTDPVIELSYSRDGGMTWGNWRSKPMGKIGEYSNRVKFRQLGSGNDIVFRLRSNSSVQHNWIAVNLEGQSLRE